MAAEDWLEDSFPRYYANSVRTQGTGYDLAIDFAFQHGGGDEPVEWLARVVLSWEEALTLRNFLTNSIRDYEENVGTIRDIEAQGESPDTGSNGNPAS